MNWYKKIIYSMAKTLYHGTSIDNYNSIKNVGLVPDVGNFVTDSYVGEYDNAGVEFDPIPLIYATDKEDLSKAVTAMTNAVANMLRKNYHQVTSNELKNYGMLIIVKEGGEYFEQRSWEETGPLGDWQGETDNQYPAVEPGDYYSEDSQNGQILVGNKMVKFLMAHGSWKYNTEELRQQLLTMAIRYHIKKSPEKKEEIIRLIQEKVNNLSDKDVSQQYKAYLERINELV